MPDSRSTPGLTALLCALLLLLSGAAMAQGEEGGDDAAATEEATDAEETDAESEDAEADEDDDDLVVETTTAPKTEAEAEISIYRELKTVESDVNSLKEKVFRSKARLLLLEEKVIRGVVSGAKAVIRHMNNLGPAYALESITYYFDGNPIYQATDVGSAGALSKQKKSEIFEANIPPGNHTLSVTGVIRGRGTGLFAYLSDYTFQFSSSYSFVAADGKTARLDAVLFKKGGALADYVEGPMVEFRARAGSKDEVEVEATGEATGEAGE